MKIDRKVDLADPKSIRKALENWNARLTEVRAEAAQLLEEFEVVEAQPLNRSELLELVTMQVDRAADWWQRQVSAQMRSCGFAGLVNGSLGASQLADPPVFGEPRVMGLTQGDAALCFLMPQTVLAGFERVMDAMPEVVPGPGRIDRMRTLANLQERIAELNTEAEALQAWITATAPLAEAAEAGVGLLGRLTDKLFN